MLYQLKLGEVVTVIPTVGVYVPLPLSFWIFIVLILNKLETSFFCVFIDLVRC